MHQILHSAIGNDNLSFLAKLHELGVKVCKNVLVCLIKVRQDRLPFLRDERFQIAVVSGYRTAIMHEMPEADALQRSLIREDQAARQSTQA
jgi:hypothetical protein